MDQPNIVSCMVFKGKKGVTKEIIGAALFSGKEVRLPCENGEDILILRKEKGTYYKLGELEYYSVFHGVKVTHDEEEKKLYGNDFHYDVCNTMYYPINRMDEAIDTFIRRIESPEGHVKDGEENYIQYKLETIGIIQNQKLVFESYYDYLNAILVDFWMEVFGKHPNDMWCGGIVSAHGDKADGYRSHWEKKNIPRHHGVLLFLLTYTKEMGDTPKHRADEWVAENYEKYLPKIIRAEEKVLKEKYSNQ